MSERPLEREQSHLLLSKIGKKVLRPGGKELTQKLVQFLEIGPEDKIVEFAPGIGFTAKMALHYHPLSYIGIDYDAEHIQDLRKKIHGKNVEFIQGDAEKTGLPEGSVDKVFGEAMLSMHPNVRKKRIIKEAHRILKKGGYYAIHELEMTNPQLDEEAEHTVKKELARAALVNAKPLTYQEWEDLLSEEGFRILKVERNPMRILELPRMIDDEGILNTLRIGMNLLTKPKVRKRLMQMRNTFRKQSGNINAIAFLLEKI